MAPLSNIDVELDHLHRRVLTLCHAGEHEEASRLYATEAGRLTAAAGRDEVPWVAFRLNDIRLQLRIPPC